MAKPESELLDLRSRAEISAVLQRYARAVDARDRASLRSCFHDDATGDYVGSEEFHTPQRIVEWILEAVGRYASTHHLNGVSEIEVDGDEARTTTPLQAAHIRSDARGGGVLFLGGIYTDTLRRSEEEWRIAHRRFEVLWRHDTATGKSGGAA